MVEVYVGLMGEVQALQLGGSGLAVRGYRRVVVKSKLLVCGGYAAADTSGAVARRIKGGLTARVRQWRPNDSVAGGPFPWGKALTGTEFMLLAASSASAGPGAAIRPRICVGAVRRGGIATTFTAGMRLDDGTPAGSSRQLLWSATRGMGDAWRRIRVGPAAPR